MLALATGIPYKWPMKIEFDPAKDARNQAKHGLSLTEGAAIFEDDNHLILPSIRHIDGEERFKVIGTCNGKLHTAVYVWRGEKVRFISMRRSNNNEERSYGATGRAQ